MRGPHLRIETSGIFHVIRRGRHGTTNSSFQQVGAPAFSYVDLGDHHPALVASAIAEVVPPYSAQMAALALLSPTVRVSKAPRNYKETISSNHPDDLKQSMDREIASITKMETFVWISVPELRRDNPPAIIIQTAWAFAEKHDKDGNLIKRKARVVVQGHQLTAGEELR
eukprot:jgi/Tetstr1/462812/TSEL_007762.t1